MRSFTRSFGGINDGTRARFAKFSRSFGKILEVLIASETCWDMFGPLRCIRTRSDTFGSVQKRSNVFGLFFVIFSTYFVLLPNTGKANDEMCAPAPPKISEMYSLKLENDNRLRQ